MRASVGKRGALAVTAALAAVVTVAGCQGDDGGKKAAGSPASSKAATRSTAGSPVDAVTAAYKKVSGYKSAKFRMTMNVPGAKGAAASTTTASGTLGWNPTVMDMTMDASEFGAGAAGNMHAELVGSAMYIDFSAQMKSDPEFAKALGAKRWMKMDLGALAGSASGGTQADSSLVNNSLQEQQSPAEQLGSLLQSPQIARVGTETVDGVKADHYKGRLTIAQALGTSDAGKSLTADQRKQLADSMKKAGITAENYDVWVGADSFPVRMDVAMDTSAGTMTVSEHLADFSAKTAEVQVPPADQSFTIQEMLKMAQQSGATS